MDQIITCVIIDDEPHSVGVMQHQLAAHCPEVSVLSTFTDSIDAYSYLKANEVDIVFIDIEMPRLNGFELLSKLEPYTFKPIITSAYDEFGIKAVKQRIFDYLVKPIDPEELKETINRYVTEHTKPSGDLYINNDRILLPLGNQVEFVDINEIIRCESDKNYTTLFLVDGKSCIVSKTMKVFEDMLPSSTFIRVHNQHIINQNYLKSYVKSEGGYFLLSDGTQVPISRYRKEEVFGKLGLK